MKICGKIFVDFKTSAWRKSSDSWLARLVSTSEKLPNDFEKLLNLAKKRKRFAGEWFIVLPSILKLSKRLQKKVCRWSFNCFWCFTFLICKQARETTVSSFVVSAGLFPLSHGVIGIFLFTFFCCLGLIQIESAALFFFLFVGTEWECWHTFHPVSFLYSLLISLTPEFLILISI